jgi:hypothetical protein
MTAPTWRNLAETAYNTYRNWLTNSAKGEPVRWEELSAVEQEAWIEAVKSVLQSVLP